MTELREPNSPATGPDPLHNLYRMSRTAGLGSGDYVAINNVAVWALILGLASILALVYPVMMLLGLIALVLGVIAMIQIGSSNGTQSGRVFAILGILCGLGFGGTAIGKIVAESVQRRNEERAIDHVVKRLNELLVAKDYAQAYQTLFSDDFKKSFSEETFKTQWTGMTGVYGDVKSFAWGERAEIDELRGMNIKRASATSMITFSKLKDAARQSIAFVKLDGEWYVNGIQNIFEKPKGDEPGGGAPAMPDPSQPQGPFFGPLPGENATPPVGPAA